MNDESRVSPAFLYVGDQEQCLCSATNTRRITRYQPEELQDLNNSNNELYCNETKFRSLGFYAKILGKIGGTMTWNVAKLESERTELLDLIRELRTWERFAIDDRQVIALSITAHMMRLSALDEEIATNRARMTVDFSNCA